MAKEDSSTEMELHNEFVETVTPVSEPNFCLLSPTPMSHSNYCNIQSGSVLPLPTVDHSVVNRRKEERSKEYLRRRKLDEIKKGKSIAFDPEDQGRSVNVKRRKFIEVAPQKSKLKLANIKKPKLGAPNLDFVKSFEEKLTKSQLQIFSDACFEFFLKLPPVMIQTQLIHSLLMMEVVQEKTDEIWLLVNGSLIHFGLGEFAIMTGLKCNGVAHENCNSWEKNNLIDRCFDGIKKIIVQTIADFFEGKCRTTDQDAVKISILHFINTFCCVTSLKIKYPICILKWSSLLKVRNISATPFEKSAMNLNDLVGDVVVNDESNGVEVASQLVDDDFSTTPPLVSSKTKNKPKYVPPMNNMNVIDAIRRISDGQKELREDFQVIKQEVHSLKKLMMESDSKNFNAIEALSDKVDSDSKQYEEFRGRGVNVDCDEEYYENNINCDQYVTLHLDNIQTINEDSNNESKIVGEVETRELAPEILSTYYIDVPKSQMHQFTCQVTRKQIDKSCFSERLDPLHQSPYLNSNGSGDNMSGGASSKSIVTVVHPFGSFTLDDKCFKEMGEFREWMNEGRRPRNKKYPYIKKDNTLNPLFEFGKTIINKKDWFHKFAFGGQTLESSKGMCDDVPVKFTTTDYLFDLKIKALYKNFIENNGDGDVVKPEHDITKYILDRSIYVYDLMGDAAFRANIRNYVDAYRFIILLFLLILNFFGKRTDIQLNNGPYKNKALVDPFNVVMIKDLPLQQDA
ncbi:hypothetical protein H5410_016508 [Solanum commersonii]|uniref:DUF1985 domain-containing protein n=1 Tax=Solanum commersonii TaxID=4109 RepID=A0A9J5ZXK5_SOLCO|nr:hypothetical protein H5410_016508 [Solanum commersonii]